MARPLRCVLVEDDPLARAVLEGHARRAGLDVLGTAGTAAEARRRLAAAAGDGRPADAVFVDVELPDGSGLDLARDAGAAQVVLVTARPDHAVAAFDLRAADYLVKPVAFDRFERAVARVRDLLAPAAEAPPETETPRDVDVDDAGVWPDGPVFVRSGGRRVALDLRRVARIEAQGDYVAFYADAAPVLVHGTLAALAERLPEAFVRVHRSHIVRLDRLDAIGASEVVAGGTAVRVGAAYRDAFREAVGRR